ncbi:MAG: DUF4190 domain-containing protein [Isosphaeraceae bacterium]
MAADQKLSDIDSEAPGSAIENEIPTYRAISPRAILALFCGFLAIFSLAHPFFYLFAILAVVLGFTADRNIQRYPDLLTGRGLAQAGVAMGLIFGLAVFTVSTVQGFIRVRNAASFAQHYASLYKSGGLGEILWWGLPPTQRTSVTPEEVLAKAQSGNRQESQAYEMRTSGLRNLKKRLDSSKEQDIHFLKIEREGTEGVTPVALALFEVHGPATKDFPSPEEYALAYLKGISKGSSGYDWWVDELVYPYKPQSAAVKEAAVDDGHGHAH